MHKNILVTGIGTDVGKTVVSAILVELFQADYWKPIECGESDSKRIQEWIPSARVHVPKYRFKKGCSPHQAALEENKPIDPACITRPETSSTLIIETVGGVLVPLSLRTLAIDLYRSWPSIWIIVIRPYIGSINHALLTLAFLKQNHISPFGLIYSGKNEMTEKAISSFSDIPVIASLEDEHLINSKTIQKYAVQWENLPFYKKILNLSGTHLHPL